MISSKVNRDSECSESADIHLAQSKQEEDTVAKDAIKLDSIELANQNPWSLMVDCSRSSAVCVQLLKEGTYLRNAFVGQECRNFQTLVALKLDDFTEFFVVN